MEKWGDHQMMKFFINNSVETLILFNEGHQGLLKLNVSLGEGAGVQCGGKQGYLQESEFSLKWKNNV